MENKIEDKNKYLFLQDAESLFPYKAEYNSLVKSDFINYKESMTDNFSVIYKFINAYGYYPAQPLRIFKLMTLLNDKVKELKLSPEIKNRIFKLMGVRYYLWHTINLVTETPDKKYFSLIYENKKFNLELWELKDYQPKFTFKTKPYITDSGDDIFKIIIGLKPFKFNNETVLIQDTNSTTFNPGQTMSKNLPMEIKLTEMKNNSFSLNVVTHETGFLVMAMNYYDGWEAYNNGKKIPIFKANHYQQALLLESGKHEIKMLYNPFSFFIGKIISFCTLLVLIILAGLYKKRVLFNNLNEVVHSD